MTDRKKGIKMPRLNDSLFSYLKRFHKLIMQEGLDVDSFLRLMQTIFRSKCICIMQLDEQNMLLKTIYANRKNAGIKDIAIQKRDIFSITRRYNKFKAFSRQGDKNYVYPAALKENGIWHCIIGPIDVVEVTEEFIIIGTQNRDGAFTKEQIQLSEMLSNFLSVKFREQQLFREGSILELAAKLGFNLSLNYLRKLHITKEFLRELKKDLHIYDLTRMRVVNTLEIFRVTTEAKSSFYIRDISSRTKEFSSILEKMSRRNKHYNELGDIAGVCVIVDYLSDIDKIVEYLRYEAPYITIVEDDRKIEKPGQGQYRGHHLTVVVETDNLRINDHAPYCEIQIRTSYQDSWSTKAHEATYKRKLNETVKKTMASLSNQLYRADRKSEILRQEIRELMDASGYPSQKN